ncbi:MAG: AAA family ATPase, partial [Nitrospiraceae bacterium]|nr:AAA family ATPase [Nitrospiraceae bacterium]
AKTVRWNPESDYWLDVAAFEQLSRNEATLEDAIALYRGDLLADCYEDLIFPEREKLRALYMTDLARLIDHYRSQRHFRQAIALASHLLATDPLRENTLRLLMRLHYEAGDRSGALKVYAAFRQRLQEELAVEPMPETLALAEAIHRDLPLPKTGKASVAALGKGSPMTDFLSRRPALDLPFVGRRDEMRQLMQQWGQATRGRGALVMIGGEAGVGKTRLVEEFAHRAEVQGGRVLMGHTLPTGELPYRPVVSALRRALPLIAALDLSTFWLAVVAQLLPELPARRGIRWSSLPKLPALDPEQEQLRLFEGLFRCLVGMSRPRPVLLILEDLHWAGAGTADLLTFLGRRLGTHPLLVVGSYRQEEVTADHPLAAVRRDLQRDALWHQLPLNPLTREAVYQLVLALTTPTDKAADLAARLFDASEGHPLFLHELLRDLMDKGALRPEEGRWQVQTVGDLPVVPGVQEAITARLSRLSAPAKTLAEIAASIGQAFPFDLLHQASGWSESELLERLDELLDAQIIREAGQRGAFDYAFSHHLVQAAIYQGAPLARRRRRHRRIGRLLAARSEAPAEIARHYELGGEPERAAAFYLEAARKALALRADKEALSALSRGKALARDKSLRWEILCEQEEIFHRRGERPRQAACLAELSALAEQMGEERHRCQVLRRYISYYRELGERKREFETILALKRHAVALDDPHWLAEVHLAEAGYFTLIGHFAQGIASLQQALPLYESLEDIEGQVACHCQWIEISAHQSHFDEAQAHLRAADELTRTRGDQTLLVRTLRATSTLTFVHQDYAESQALTEQMLTLCRQIGDRKGEADAHARLATIAARRFRVEEASQHYQQAAELYALVDKRQGQAAVHLNAGILAVNLGRYREGLDRFARAETLFRALEDSRGLAVCALNQSAAAIHLEAWDAALKWAQRAYDLAHPAGMAFIEVAALGNLGEIALNRGALREAVGYLRRSLALRRQMAQGPGDSATDLSLLALALLRLGDEAAAQQTADRLVTLCKSTCETIAYPQLALWVAAQVYRQAGAANRADDLLTQAHALLDQRAATIPDPASREAFLRIAYNREIQLAWQESIWPDLSNQ